MLGCRAATWHIGVTPCRNLSEAAVAREASLQQDWDHELLCNRSLALRKIVLSLHLHLGKCSFNKYICARTASRS